MSQKRNKRSRNEFESELINNVKLPLQKKPKYNVQIITSVAPKLMETEGEDDPFIEVYNRINCWKLLPKDLKVEILKYLDLYDITSLYTISTEFRELIDNKALIKSWFVNFAKENVKCVNCELKSCAYLSTLVKSYEYFHEHYINDERQKGNKYPVVNVQCEKNPGIIYSFVVPSIYSKRIHSFMQQFKHHQIVQACNRITNYTLSINYGLKIIHQENITPRTLNYYEKKIFKEFVNYKDLNLNNCDELLNSREKCINILERRYSLSKWKEYVDWSCIVWAGGALLGAVDDNCNTGNEISDIDLFGYNVKGEAEMNELIHRFTFWLYKDGHEVSRVSTTLPLTSLEVTFVDNGNKVKFDFIFRDDIFEISTVFNNFDLDICQLGYDGYNFVCTDAWIEAIRTRTMICATLPKNEFDMKHCMYRIEKYIKRGYKLIIPHDVDPQKILQNIVCKTFTTKSKKVKKSSGVHWMFRHDISKIKEKFIQLLQ